MARKLEFSTSLDSSGYARGIRDMEMLSQRAGTRINGALQGTSAGYSKGTGSLEGHGGRGGVIGEGVVLMRELGRGNYSRIPGSLSIFVQRLGILKYFIKDNVAAAEELTAAMEKQALRAANVAKWTTEEAAAIRAAYTAEGTNIVVSAMDVEMAERKAVAARVNAEALHEQALAQKESEAAAGTSISKFGIYAIILAIVAGAIYLLIRHFKALAAEQKNFADLTDITTHSFEEQAKAVKSAAEVHQAEIDRLKELANSEKGVKDAIDETLKSMRERASLEKELASAKGASKGQLAQMDIAAAETELAFLKQTNLELEKKVDLDKQAELKASKRMEDFKSGTGLDSESSLNNANTKAQLAAKIKDAIQKAMTGKIISENTGRTVFTPQGPVPEFSQRPANASDKFKVTVDGVEYLRSLNEASAAYDSVASEATRLAAIQKKIADTLKEKQALTTEDMQNLNRRKSEAASLESSLGLKKEFLPQIAAAEMAKSSIGKSSGGGLVKTGNFLGSARGQIESLQKEANNIARQHLGVARATLTAIQNARNPQGREHFVVQ